MSKSSKLDALSGALRNLYYLRARYRQIASAMPCNITFILIYGCWIEGDRKLEMPLSRFGVFGLLEPIFQDRDLRCRHRLPTPEVIQTTVWHVANCCKCFLYILEQFTWQQERDFFHVWSTDRNLLRMLTISQIRAKYQPVNTSECEMVYSI